MERAARGSSAVVVKRNKNIEEEKQKEEVEDESRIVRFVVRPRNNVSFAVGTIDNENMDKKKSKGKYM